MRVPLSLKTFDGVYQRPAECWNEGSPCLARRSVQRTEGSHSPGVPDHDCQSLIPLIQGTNIQPFPDLEPTQICNGDESCYDNTVLERIDEFMLDAHSYGIKVRARALPFYRFCWGSCSPTLTGTAHHHDAQLQCPPGG